jgi:hypothetical protein
MTTNPTGWATTLRGERSGVTVGTPRDVHYWTITSIAGLIGMAAIEG